MSGEKALQRATSFWFAVVVLGQWTFVFYLAAHYLAPALRGGLAAWSGNNLATGYVAGDALGNVAVAAHIFMAGLILAAGQFQLVPKLRAAYPRLHRWSGRFFLGGAVIASVTGLYMVWARGNPQAGLAEHIGTSTGALLNLAFAALALKAARARNIASHRRWALRLFITVSGVWFIRVGYGLWFFAHGGPAAPSKAFAIFISYAQYAIPLALLELYLRVSMQGCDRSRHALAILILLLTMLIAAGVYHAAIHMWLPRLR